MEVLLQDCATDTGARLIHALEQISRRPAPLLPEVHVIWQSIPKPLNTGGGMAAPAKSYVEWSQDEGRVLKQLSTAGELMRWRRRASKGGGVRTEFQSKVRAMNQAQEEDSKVPGMKVDLVYNPIILPQQRPMARTKELMMPSSIHEAPTRTPFRPRDLCREPTSTRMQEADDGSTILRDGDAAKKPPLGALGGSLALLFFDPVEDRPARGGYPGGGSSPTDEDRGLFEKGPGRPGAEQAIASLVSRTVCTGCRESWEDLGMRASSLHEQLNNERRRARPGRA